MTWATTERSGRSLRTRGVTWAAAAVVAAAALGATPANAAAASPAPSTVIALSGDDDHAMTRPAPVVKATPVSPPKATPKKQKATKVKGSRGVRLGRKGSRRR